MIDQQRIIDLTDTVSLLSKEARENCGNNFGLAVQDLKGTLGDPSIEIMGEGRTVLNINRLRKLAMDLCDGNKIEAAWYLEAALDDVRERVRKLYG